MESLLPVALCSGEPPEAEVPYGKVPASTWYVETFCGCDRNGVQFSIMRCQTWGLERGVGETRGDDVGSTLKLKSGFGARSGVLAFPHVPSPYGAALSRASVPFPWECFAVAFLTAVYPCVFPFLQPVCCALCRCRAVCEPQKAAGGLSAPDTRGDTEPPASGSGIAGKGPPAAVAQTSGKEAWFHLVDGYQAHLLSPAMPTKFP